jgi:deazaflavin-dependent oxidoreductase (nitroreductase family)
MADEDRHKESDLSRKPAHWWRAVRERDLERVHVSGTTDSLQTGKAAGVVITTIGARTRLPRAVPVIRFEHEGVYAVVGSKGGDARDPDWCANLRAHHAVRLQDQERTHDMVAREAHGEERETWWRRIVTTQPVYGLYAARTTRVIPVFILEPEDPPAAQ